MRHAHDELRVGCNVRVLTEYLAVTQEAQCARLSVIVQVKHVAGEHGPPAIAALRKGKKEELFVRKKG